MKVLGIELSDWKEYPSIWARDKKRPLSFIYIYKIQHFVSFSSKFYQIQKLFDELYSDKYLSELSIEEVKQLVDKFLVDINNLKAFI